MSSSNVRSAVAGETAVPEWSAAWSDHLQSRQPCPSAGVEGRRGFRESRVVLGYPPPAAKDAVQRAIAIGRGLGC